MNRLLVFIVILLIPVAIYTELNDDEVFMVKEKNYTVDIPVIEEENIQVLLSANDDKSDAFTMELEDYIIGVVAGEMPASFDMEALKAQAVASRSFAMYKMASNQNYVLSTTINDQVYLTAEEMKQRWKEDYSYYYNRVKEAVRATEGEILTYQGDIASTYYFAISNGYTDDALTVFQEDKDYLISVDSSWDKNYQAYSSTYTLSKDKFCSKLGLSCGDVLIGEVLRAPNHYVREIIINGTTFTGLEVFQKLNLKSTDFTISVYQDQISIVTLGFGHGVGMSQYGAHGMASSGYLYEEILDHYYPDTELIKL